MRLDIKGLNCSTSIHISTNPPDNIFIRIWQIDFTIWPNWKLPCSIFSMNRIRTIYRISIPTIWIKSNIILILILTPCIHLPFPPHICDHTWDSSHTLLNCLRHQKTTNILFLFSFYYPNNKDNQILP